MRLKMEFAQLQGNSVNTVTYVDKTLGVSTVQSWVAIYKKELERKRRI